MKMKLRKQIKLNAKRCLCNNWGKAVSIVLLTSAIYLLFVIIEMLANLLLRCRPLPPPRRSFPARGCCPIC